jgi:hypothetical protein
LSLRVEYLLSHVCAEWDPFVRCDPIKDECRRTLSEPVVRGGAAARGAWREALQVHRAADRRVAPAVKRVASIAPATFGGTRRNRSLREQAVRYHEKFFQLCLII